VIAELLPVGRDGLFCLFLLFGDDFLSGGSPIPEALTPGPRAGRPFEFFSDPSDGLRDMWYWDLEVEQTAPHTKDTTVLEVRVEGIRPFDVELPLVDGKLTGDVIDDLTLLEAPGGDDLEKVDKRSQQGADDNTSGSNQGDKDGIGHNLDRESLLQGMGWSLAFAVGFVVGSWIGAKIGVWLAYALPLGDVFQQNAKRLAHADTQTPNENGQS